MTLKPEHIVEELDRTPKLKRDLIMKMMEVMLDMAQIIVRLFRKNKVRPDDAEKVLDRAREDYLETCVHSDKS